MENPIRRYLEDAIAAEKSFETQLRGFAKEASLSQAERMFEQHAEETKIQYGLLTSRLEALGGSTSVIKSFLAHLFNSAPKIAQAGHADEERTTQDLMMAFAVENAEVAMYEALFVAAETAGDGETAGLARRIQAQEQETADKVWSVIPTAATQAFEAVRTRDEEESRNVVRRYLEDAEGGAKLRGCPGWLRQSRRTGRGAVAVSNDVGQGQNPARAAGEKVAEHWRNPVHLKERAGPLAGIHSAERPDGP